MENHEADEGNALRALSMPFENTLCTMFEKVSGNPGRRGKTVVVSRFWKRFVGRFSPTELYPIIRLVAPEADTERGSFGLKERKIADYYVKALGIGKTSPYCGMLRNYTNPNFIPSALAATAGDLPSVLCAVAKSFQTVKDSEGSLTVGDVETLLGDLLKAKEKERVGVFRRMIRLATPVEQKWIVRIVLKDLKLGLSVESRLKLFDRRTEHLQNVHVSLLAMCEELERVSPCTDSGMEKLSAKGICPFDPLRPMLASQPRAPFFETILSDMPDGFVMEKKYDGERILCHCDKENARLELFSRNSKRQLLYEKVLRDTILGAMDSGKCILDGEIVVWDKLNEREERFGTLQTVAKRIAEGDECEYSLCLVVFDILFWGDEDLTRVKHGRRMDVLKTAVLAQIPHGFEIISQRMGNTEADLIESMEEAIASRDEGRIIKSVDSFYEPGQRSQVWVKWKPEYFGHLADTLDLAVVGGFYAKGSRNSGRVISFLCCVLNTEEGEYRSLTKVGSGVSNDAVETLEKKLESHWQSQPTIGSSGLEMKDIPDVWIEPKHSVVLEVQASEIVPSRTFSSGFSLRFPRLIAIREDKDVDDCLSYSQLLSLVEQAGYQGRLFAHRVAGEMPSSTRPTAMTSAISLSEVTTGRARGRKRRGQFQRSRSNVDSSAKPSKRRRSGVLSSFALPPSSTASGTLFCGLEFYVFSFPRTMGEERDAVRRKIVEGGGTIVANPRSATSHLIGYSDETRDVQRWIAYCRSESSFSKGPGRKSVLSSRWVDQCVKSSSIVPIASPAQVIFANEDLERILGMLFDKWGDSHVVQQTPESLEKIFETIEDGVVWSCDVSAVLRSLSDEERTAFVDVPLISFFHVVSYVDWFDAVSDSSTRFFCPSIQNVILFARLYGMKVVDKITSETTHVIMSKGDVSRMSSIRESIRRVSRGRKNVIVICSILWVQQCLIAQKMLPCDEYVVNSI